MFQRNTFFGMTELESREKNFTTHICQALLIVMLGFSCVLIGRLFLLLLLIKYGKKGKIHTNPGQYPFNGVSDLPGYELLQNDNAVLNLAMAFVQKEAMDDGRKTPELKYRKCQNIWQAMQDEKDRIRKERELKDMKSAFPDCFN